jgi:hypothetical protein
MFPYIIIQYIINYFPFVIIAPHDLYSEITNLKS